MNDPEIELVMSAARVLTAMKQVKRDTFEITPETGGALVAVSDPHKVKDLKLLWDFLQKRWADEGTTMQDSEHDDTHDQGRR